MSLKSPGDECYLDFSFDNAVMGPLRGDQMTIIGTWSARAPYDSPLWQTYELAASELNGPSGLPRIGARPALLVTCNDATDEVPLAVEHLVRRIGADAILGSPDRSVSESIVEHMASDDRIVILPATNDLADDAPDRLWYLPPRRPDTAPHVAILRRLAARLGPIRLATIVSDADIDRSWAFDLASTFALQGDTLVDAIADSLELQLADATPANRVLLIDQIVTFRPHLVLVFASGAFESPVGARRIAFIRDLEQRWPSDVMPPYYLLSPRNEADSLEGFSEEPTFARRVLAVRSVDASAPPGSTLAVPNAPERDDLLRLYDAVYFLAYAGAAAQRLEREGQPASSALPTALSSLVTEHSAQVDVGPGTTGLDLGTSLIAAETPFRLRGATETPTPGTGAPSWAPLMDSEWYCPVGGDATDAPGAVFDRIGNEFIARSAEPPPCLLGLLDAGG